MRDFCELVVAAWQAGDVPLYRILDRSTPPELVPELLGLGARLTVRSWLGQRNRIASDYLWDGKPKSALNAMLTLGFKGKASTQLIRDKRAVTASVKRFNKHKERIADALTPCAQAREGGWHEVKAVRSRVRVRHSG